MTHNARDPALDGWKPRSLDGFFGLLGPLWTRKEAGAWAYAFLPDAKHVNQQPAASAFLTIALRREMRPATAHRAPGTN